MVKRWGKSPPRRQQCSAARKTPPGATPNRRITTLLAESAGRWLEPRGDSGPRGMTVTEGDLRQNPAYRPASHHFPGPSTAEWTTLGGEGTRHSYRGAMTVR